MLWQSVFQCGIPHIDAQHKALFEHIEMLGTMHGDISRIPVTIEFLEQYAKEHFSDEESLHDQVRFPRALEHQRQHKDFVRQIENLKKTYEECGHSLSTLMDMNHSLVAWLTGHILQMDKMFAEFFRALPGDVRKGVNLPHRPWIPESSQEAYERTGNTTAVRSGAGPRPRPGSTTALVSTGGSWTDSMLCGIPLIDDQHKELFRQIDILRNRNNKDRVPGVLRFLADYVVKHFNDEESMHLRSRFPAAKGHRKLHTDFVDKFWEMKAKYDKSEGDFASLMEVNKLVYEWLREHVLKVDKEFAKYYLALPEE